MLEFLRTGRPGRETCEQHCWTSQQWHSTPRTPNNGETTIGESSAIFYKQVSRVQPNSCFHGLHFTRHCRLQWTKENNRSGRSRQFTASITPKNITPKNSAPGIGAARNPAIQLRFRTRIPATLRQVLLSADNELCLGPDIQLVSFATAANGFGLGGFAGEKYFCNIDRSGDEIGGTFAE